MIAQMATAVAFRERIVPQASRWSRPGTTSTTPRIS